MIKVTFREKGDDIIGFSCQGHAGYAPEGSDIVCAAVSCLTETCVNALESVAGVRAEVQIGDGSMDVLLPGSAGHDAQVILKSLRQGLRDVAEEYPRYLRLTEKQ